MKKKKKWRVKYDYTIAGTIIVPADSAEQARKLVETMIMTGKLSSPSRKAEYNDCFHVGEEPEPIGEGE